MFVTGKNEYCFKSLNKNIMKKYFAFLVLMAFTFSSYSQQAKENEQKLTVDYLKKSKKKLKTGVILLSSGAVLFLGGTYLTEHGCSCKDPTGSLLMLGGMSMATISIPFFISSASSKHKAKLYMNKETLVLIPNIKAGIAHNSIGVKIKI